MTFQALFLHCCSDKGLMLLKMSALFIFNHNLIHIYLSTQLIKPNCIETPSFSSLKMQHQSFSRNLPPLFIGCMCKQLATANPIQDTTTLHCEVLNTTIFFFFNFHSAYKVLGDQGVPPFTQLSSNLVCSMLKE